jgi:endonuclease-3 related protein
MLRRKSYPNKVLIEIYHLLFKAFGPQHWWPGNTPFEVIVGAILTQNTNWGNVEKAINNIKAKGALNPKALYAMPHKKLASLIKPAGYFNVKAARLKNFLSFFANHYGGSIRRMNAEEPYALRNELLEVNGIGPETADSMLLYALQKPIFVIDAYTKRVLYRHKVAREDATYHELQDIFHRSISPDVQLYNEFHALFVRVGKEYCKPKPRCEGCPLKGLNLPAEGSSK